MANQQWQLMYQVCPIILTGGIAAQMSGGMLPILSLLNNGSALSMGNITGGLDNAFAAFTVMPGGSLVSQSVAKYPFANQSVAANATIREPLTLTVIMETPMRGPNAWVTKFVTMGALKSTLDSHNNAGGTYTVMTPAYMYDNMIMTQLADASRSTNSVPQNAWRFDFEKPLVTLAEAQGALSQLMSKITNGVQAAPSTSSLTTGLPVGQSPLQIDSTPGVGGMTTASSLLAPGAVPSNLVPGGWSPNLNVPSTTTLGSFTPQPNQVS